MLLARIIVYLRKLLILYFYILFNFDVIYLENTSKEVLKDKNIIPFFKYFKLIKILANNHNIKKIIFFVKIKIFYSFY